MRKGYWLTIPCLLAAAMLLLFGAAMAAAEQSLEELIAQEESGIELPETPEPAVSVKPSEDQIPVLNNIPQDSVLLIPETNADVVGMYDPYDGTYLGDVINGSGILTFPINAIQGPDDNIYVSDQTADGVFVFDTSGTYLYTYCDGTDGLDNVRGIDFRNDTLFVTSGDDYVAMFHGAHNRLADFINGGMDPFDIYFLDDGRALVADITGDAIRLYDADGTFISSIVSSLDFPEQVIYDDLAPGDFLNATFVTGNQITDFDIDGTIQQTTVWEYGRGVHRLGNGNLLATSSHNCLITVHSFQLTLDEGN